MNDLVTTSETTSNDYDVEMKNIFNMFDTKHDGYISIDSFLTIFKENWPLNLDENKLDNLVQKLDPFGMGKINYEQFVDGITQMSQLNNNNNNLSSIETPTPTTTTTTKTSTNKNNKNKFNYEPDRNSNGSTISSNDTFNEYDTLTDSEYHTNHQLNTHSNNNNETSIIDLSESMISTFENSSNTIKKTNNNKILDSNMSNIKSSKKRASEQYRNSNQQLISESYPSFENLSLNQNFNNDNNQEQLIHELEAKIRHLENQIDELKSDKLDYIDRYSKLQIENANLLEKLHETEEINHDLEKNYKLTIESEKARYNDYIMKLNTKHSEEKDVLLTQLNKNESDINYYKEEISRYTRQINELNRTVDTKSLNEYQLDEKLNNLKLDYQRLTKEKDLYKEDLETLTIKHKQREEALTKELTELRILQQKHSKRRGTVIQTDEAKLKELELELQQSRSECKHLQLSIEDLEARLLRSSLDTGKLLLTQANVPSLAAEMETLSKDELMDKLKNEQTTTLRYREYIERILAAIMEKNPEILEIRQSTTGTAKISANKSAVTYSKY